MVGIWFWHKLRLHIKNSMNRITRNTPFEIVRGVNPKGESNLKDVIVGEEKRSVKGEVFVKYMSSLHKEVKLNLE